jgi:hypothetical protein
LIIQGKSILAELASSTYIVNMRLDQPTTLTLGNLTSKEDWSVNSLHIESFIELIWAYQNHARESRSITHLKVLKLII